MQNEEQRGEQYARISELDDYRVSEEDPDPRGWAVVDRDGVPFGRVEDLIVDRSAMKVMYLDVSVAGAPASAPRARIPAASVDLQPEERSVLASLSRADLAAHLGSDYQASDYQASAVEDADETPAMARAAGMTDYAAATAGRAAGTIDTDESQRLTRSEEELRVGTRPVEAGEVVVAKHVETEHVSTPVQRRVERVRIERRPVTGATTGQVELREGEIRVPVMEEEVVVEKRPVIKEEIVIAREATTETETVEADVRRERIDVSGDDALIEGDATTRHERARGGSRG